MNPRDEEKIIFPNPPSCITEAYIYAYCTKDRIPTKMLSLERIRLFTPLSKEVAAKELAILQEAGVIQPKGGFYQVRPPARMICFERHNAQDLTTFLNWFDMLFFFWVYNNVRLYDWFTIGDALRGMHMEVNQKNIEHLFAAISKLEEYTFLLADAETDDIEISERERFKLVYILERLET